MMQQSRPDHVAGHWLGKDVLVWSAEGRHLAQPEPDVHSVLSVLCLATGAERLSSQWRVVGGRIGANPHNPRQNSDLGLPLLLHPEEVELLCNKGKHQHTTCHI